MPMLREPNLRYLRELIDTIKADLDRVEDDLHEIRSNVTEIEVVIFQ